MSSILLNTCLAMGADKRPSPRFLSGPGPATIDAFMADPSKTVGMVAVNGEDQSLHFAIPLAFRENFDTFVFVSSAPRHLYRLMDNTNKYVPWFIADENTMSAIPEMEHHREFAVLGGGGVFLPGDDTEMIEALKTRVADGAKTAIFTTYEALDFVGAVLRQAGGQTLAIFDKAMFATTTQARDAVFTTGPRFFTKGLFFSWCFPSSFPVRGIAENGVNYGVDCSGSGELGPGARFTMGRLLAEA